MTTIRTREELETMSDGEMRNYHAGLKADIRKIHEKTVARHAEMKLLGMNKRERANDEQIKMLHGLMTNVNAACTELCEFRKNRAMEKALERETNELALMQVEMEKARLFAENKDVIAIRNAKAEERRPKGPNVWFGAEFKNIRGSEKRLIVMMAREIGQERYQELRRIALWDEHHKNNRYYTGNDDFDGKRGLF